MNQEYRRTTGFRNWINKICWLPNISGRIATIKSGRMYKITNKGWRRI